MAGTGSPSAFRRWVEWKKDGRWRWWEAFIVILVPPALGLYALSHYPLLDGSDPLFLWSFVGGVVLGLALALLQGNLFGFHRTTSAFRLLGVPVLAGWIGLSTTGVALFLNGALDGGDAAREPFTVGATWVDPPPQRGDTLWYAEARSARRGLYVDLTLDPAVWHRVAEGDTVWFDVRPGLLGGAWYQGYEIGGPP